MLYPRTDIAIPARCSSGELQRLLNDAEGATVVIPPGVYDLQSPINLPPEIDLLGSGRDDTVFVADTPRHHVFGATAPCRVRGIGVHGSYTHAFWYGPCREFEISDCAMYGGTGQAVFMSGGAQKGVVAGNEIGRGADSPYSADESKFQCGINIDPGGGADLQFVRNVIRDTTRGGIICNNTTRACARQNHIERIGGDGVATGYGIQFYRPSSGPWPFDNTHNVAVGNTILQTDGTPIYLLASSHALVELNSIGRGVLTQEVGPSMLVAGIAVAPSYDSEHPLGVEQYSVVRRNTIVECRRAPAIACYGLRITIDHNSVYGATHGVYGWGMQDCAIIANQLRDCSAQPIYHLVQHPPVNVLEVGNTAA